MNAASTLCIHADVRTVVWMYSIGIRAKYKREDLNRVRSAIRGGGEPPRSGLKDICFLRQRRVVREQGQQKRLGQDQQAVARRELRECGAWSIRLHF